MENPNRERGLSTRSLLILGLILVIGGSLGSSLLQRGILGIGSRSPAQLLEQMQSSGSAMTTATVALVLQVLETCAVPIFAWLITWTMSKNQFAQKQAVALTALTVISEPLYDMAVFGEPFAFSEQNPLWGLLIAGIMLYFIRRYAGRGGTGVLVGILVMAAAILWCNMLRVKNGTFLQILTLSFWLLRGKPLVRNFAAVGLGVVCSLLSPFYLASPMGALVLHFHREDEEPVSLLPGIAYPLVLLAAAAGTALLQRL